MTDIPWDYPSPHTVDVTVGPEHIDVMRHTNNVVYLQWLEQVAWSHSQSLGLGPAEYEALGHGMVVREHVLTYLQATRLGESLRLATCVDIAEGRLRRMPPAFHAAYSAAALPPDVVAAFIPKE
jgi:acyl-CoA thioester hydrolase